MAYVARFCALLPMLCLWFVVACTTTSGTGKVYRVKVEAGDSLASIAMQYDTTWQKIAKLNGITSSGQLKVGSVIRVEPGPGGIVAETGNIRVLKTSRSPAAAPGEAAKAEPRRGLLFGRGAANSDVRGVISGTDLNWPVYGQLSSHFGRRGRRQHQGIDIRAKYGTPIMAAGSGIVEFSGRKRGYGRVVIIKHAQYKTLYAHLSTVEVSRGDTVDQHTEIGAIGTSGNSTGPHLHFEIRRHDNVAINPLTVLEKDKLLSSTH
jgi:murein DD-endopeptidase MepM/ murein hydrolase activator NlpD